MAIKTKIELKDEISKNKLTKQLLIDFVDSFNDVLGGLLLDGNVNITGDLDLDGSLTINVDKVTVDATTGNTVIAGDLDVAGELDIASGKFIFDSATGNVIIDGLLSVGNSSPKVWNSAYKAMQIGDQSAIAGNSSKTMLMDHMFIDSTGSSVHLSDDLKFATKIELEDGGFAFYRSSSRGLDGAGISLFIEAFRVENSGYVYAQGLNTSGTGNPVYITASGQLWENTSSRRFKMGETGNELNTGSVLNLTSKTYFRKKEEKVKDKDGKETGEVIEIPVAKEHGPIAEDAYLVNPEFCTYDKDGKTPRGLHERNIMFAMLEEMKKMRAELDALKNKGN